MTQTVAATAQLGPDKTGLAIGLRVLNMDGTVYSAFSTTGVAETSVLGTYRKANGVVVPDAGGTIVWGVSGTDYVESPVDPASPTAAAVGSEVWTGAYTRQINSVLGTVTLADDGITAAKLAASAITEIQSGLATSAALEAVDDYLDTEIAAIKAKTDLISAATLTVSSPVAENGDTELYAGDDYNNSDGRALEWTSSDWPDLTSATITLYLRAPDGSKFSKAGSAPVVGSGSQTARVELTASETATLIDWPTPSTLRLRATLAVSGRIVTLVTGVLTVAEDIS